MRVFIRSKGRKRSATCRFLDRPDDQISALWQENLSAASADRERDSVEFLESAFSKWRLYEARKRTASSERQLSELIRKDPSIDALAILTLRAPWAGLGSSLGICQFRRTWRHNVAIDYLAVHPSLLRGRTVSGVGTALLYSVAMVASRIGADSLWLETTDLSANYYSRLLGTDETSDHVIISVKTLYTKLLSYFDAKSFE
jgi:hypothetical protein